MNQENNQTAQNNDSEKKEVETPTPISLPPLPPKPPETENTEQPEQSGSSEEELQKKKEAFQKKIKLAGFITIGVIAAVSLFSIGRFAYNKTKSTYSTQPVPETTESSQEIIKKEEVPINTNEWEIYSSEKYGFSFDYPKGDAIIVSDVTEDEFLVQVYSTDVLPEENPNAENLIKGYIFQINPLKLGARNLDSAVSVKKEYYTALCPETASVTDTVDLTVSNIEGKGFKVFNCSVDYAVSFVTSGDYIYEITQIYKGDVGFQQVYKAKTNQILQSVVIQQDLVEEPTHIVFDSDYGFSFSYPKDLDSDYSDAPYPPQDTAQKIITVAENDNTNAAGFFFGRGGQDFEFKTYMDEQTQLLIDDYTVVKGRAPEGVKTELTVSGKTSYLMEGYTWEGNDLIFIPLNKYKGCLIISKTNISDEIFNDILKSIVIED